MARRVDHLKLAQATAQEVRRIGSDDSAGRCPDGYCYFQALPWRDPSSSWQTGEQLRVTMPRRT